MTEIARRPRGRPRNEQTRDAVLSAAFELGASDDAQDFSVAGIAALAGVSKQTVYRWWPSKGDVLLEAIARNADIKVPTVDHGSYERDLYWFMKVTYDELKRPGMRIALRNLMAQSQQDQEFQDRFRQGLIDRRRAALQVIVKRADERGDLPPGLSHDLIGDIVAGVHWYRLLATGRPLDDGDAEALAGFLAQRPQP